MMLSVSSSPGSARSERGANSLGCMQCLQHIFGNPLHLNHVCNHSWVEKDGAFTVCEYCHSMGKNCEDVDFPPD